MLTSVDLWADIIDPLSRLPEHFLHSLHLHHCWPGLGHFIVALDCWKVQRREFLLQKLDFGFLSWSSQK